MSTGFKNILTVSDAAARFRKSGARIRQICIENEIGVLVGDRIRLLTEGDMRRIGEIIRKTGKNSGPKKS